MKIHITGLPGGNLLLCAFLLDYRCKAGEKDLVLLRISTFSLLSRIPVGHSSGFYLKFIRNY